MPIPLLHSVLSWFLKKRVHQIELFLKYPSEVQSELLTKLIDQAKNTWFGKEYGFSSIKSMGDLQIKSPFQPMKIWQNSSLGRAREQNLFWPTSSNGLPNRVERPMLKASLSVSMKP